MICGYLNTTMDHIIIDIGYEYIAPPPPTHQSNTTSPIIRVAKQIFNYFNIDIVKAFVYDEANFMV